MRRYQNPEVFEHLAMSYVLGTLQGRARKRFETLQSRHFYLKAVTNAYADRFSGMVDLLPATEPPPHVWQKLQKQLHLAQTQPESKKKSILRSAWLQWGSVGFASVAASLLTFWALNSVQPNMYFAQLHSDQFKPMAMASISKQDMKLVITLPETMPAPKGTVPTLWCLSNQEGMKPMRVGRLKPNGSVEFDIDQSTWDGLATMNQLAISLEPEQVASLTEIQGKIIYEGHLKHVR